MTTSYIYLLAMFGCSGISLLQEFLFLAFELFRCGQEAM